MDDEARELESAAVFQSRYKEARQAGLPPDDALLYAASDADVGELRKLILTGCPPETIGRIVL